MIYGKEKTFGKQAQKTDNDACIRHKIVEKRREFSIFIHTGISIDEVLEKVCDARHGLDLIRLFKLKSGDLNNY